jgi:hypothetical protein
MTKKNTKTAIKKVSQEELRLEAYLFLKEYREFIASMKEMTKALNAIAPMFIAKAKKQF